MPGDLADEAEAESGRDLLDVPGKKLIVVAPGLCATAPDQSEAIVGEKSLDRRLQ